MVTTPPITGFLEATAATQRCGRILAEAVECAAQYIVDATLSLITLRGAGSTRARMLWHVSCFIFYSVGWVIVTASSIQ